MTVSITEEYLTEIRRRCEQTTPGPWEAFVEGRDFDGGSSMIRTAGEDIELYGATEFDYDFIAHAKQDVPRLLDEIDRLRKLLNR